MYARPFIVEDDDFKGVIPARAAKNAIKGVPSIASVSPKQMDYVWKVLELDENSRLTFRMFAVMTALTERVTAMDAHCRHLLEIANLTDIERKMGLYKAMFYCNNPGIKNPNYITADSLKIDLMAGGLNYEQQEYIMNQMQPTPYREITFIDYLCYIPLFMSMHDNINDNPLDMSSTKYIEKRPASVQKDMNPLGYPLRKDTRFIQKHSQNDNHKKAHDLLLGKDPLEVSTEGVDIFSKYQKLPHIASEEKSKKGKPIY